MSGTNCIYPANNHFFYVSQKPHPSKPDLSCKKYSPRLENLIKNGGFEDWVSGCLPLSWKGSNLLSNSYSHTGIAAVQLGRFICSNPEPCKGSVDLALQLPASLFQEVEVLPGHVLALNFYSSLWIRKTMLRDEPHTPPLENPPLQVNLTWLNNHGQPLGIGICLNIPSNTLGPLWSSFREVSSIVPHKAVKARLSITKSADWPVLIDDVSLHVKN